MRSTRAAVAVALLLAGAADARAQAAAGPVFRGDVSGAVGWLNAEKSELPSNRSSNDWYNRSVYGGAAAAWYWTDHWKTEIEGGASTAADLIVYTPIVIEGRQSTLFSTYTFSTTRLAVGQQYQFYRNVWVHPFVTAGVDLTWERRSRRDENYSSQGSRIDDTYPTRTKLLTRPFATVGLKAYVGPQAFFRTDMKLTFDRGVDEVLFRFGAGVDF